MAKKKKEDGIWAMVLILCILFLAILVMCNVVSLIYPSENCKEENRPFYLIPFTLTCAFAPFNPDTDVCLEWSACNKNNHICSYPTILGEESVNDFIEMNPHYDWEKLCKLWRPKTKCELNPEDEGCICDEYKQIQNYKKHYFDGNAEVIMNGSEVIVFYLEYKLKDGNIIEMKNVADILSNVSWTSRYNDYLVIHTEDGVENGSCISSHLPNECEKENPNWILDGKCNGDIYDSEEKNENGIPFEKLCSTEWVEICRKKNLEDFSCNDLKIILITYPEALEFHIDYGRLRRGHNPKTYEGFSREQLTDIMQGRECEI